MPTRDQTDNRRFIAVGGGNMAETIILGAVEAGVLDPARTTVCDPNPDRRTVFASRGLAITPTAADALAEGHAPTGAAVTVMLAVKPQMLADVAEQARDALDQLAARAASVTIVSILAGTTIDRLRTTLAPTGAHIVRVMPNTPALVGKGMTAVCPAPGVPDGATAGVVRLFTALGDVVQLGEAHMDAFTAVAGSGPAYLFLLAEALTDAAAAAGFDAALAERLARQTVVGAAELLARSPDTAADLRRRVTSPGGTTAAALSVLEDRGLRDVMRDAVAAATRRGRELAEGR